MPFRSLLKPLLLDFINMRLNSISFGMLLNGLSVSVIRVVDKPDGLPNEPKEFVEFMVNKDSLSLDYRLTEDETKMLIKMLELSINAD